ncbi:cation:proton antiporter, partial [Streptomyces sp. NPDC004629]
VTAGIEPSLGPLATAYVLILVILGPLTARWTEPLALGLVRRFGKPAVAGEAAAGAEAEAAVAAPRDAAEDQDAVGRA